jgi:H+/Cl- antiporter ClcA
VLSCIGAVVILAWFIVYEVLNKLIWDNSLVAGNRWLFPVVCLPFSLLVGLLVKYAKAPSNMEGGSLVDSLTGDPAQLTWKDLPALIVQSLASLLSGAVLGPEGAVGHIACKLAAMYFDLVKVPLEQRARLVYATVASGYNGLLANPVFTAVLSTEVGATQGKAGLAALPATLIGGAVGYAVFLVTGQPGFFNILHLPPVPAYHLSYALLMIPLALVGVLLAVLTGLFMKLAERFFVRFKRRIVLRALIAGVIFSIAGVVAPTVMFSGETQVQTVIDEAAGYGFLLLLALALAKLALLAVGFRSGFLGGPIFPIVFASTCVALAVGVLVPALPLTVLVAGIAAGATYVVFRTPLMVILLNGFMLAADETLLALIVVALAVAMIVMPPLEGRMAARQAARAQKAVPAQPAGDDAGQKPAAEPD